jgi:putative transposase
MQEIAGKRRRFGYRRIGVLLERKGMIMNHIGARIAKGLGDLLQGGALYRLYREEGLSVKRRRGRKRARGTRTPMPEAARPNARWSLDFLSDSFGASRKFRILAVIDDCCRENLCLMADTSISGARVARELDELLRVYGKPGCIVSDNGTEFTSRAILKWARPERCTMALNRPREATAERLHRVVQRQPAPLSADCFAIACRAVDELLNEEIFDTLNDARRKLALWRYDYNAVRPHSSLGNQTPLQARRALEQFEGSAPGALAQTETHDYQNQTRRLSL